MAVESWKKHVLYHLYCHFCGHGRVNHGCQLVRCENSERVVGKVHDRDELVVTDSLEAPKSQVSLFGQTNVVSEGQNRRVKNTTSNSFCYHSPWHHDRITDKFPELLSHIVVVVVQKVCHWFQVEAGLRQKEISFTALFVVNSLVQLIILNHLYFQGRNYYHVLFLDVKY